MIYVATFHGDIGDLRPIAANSLGDVLQLIKDIHRFGELGPDKWNQSETILITPDPEDDKIEVWEFNPETHEGKIVWGFWGWHWETPPGLGQGTLPGYAKSLYALAMDED